LKNWHGHDGSLYINDSEFFAALHEGRYHGEWVMPPMDALGGHHPCYNRDQADSLYAHRNESALKGAFTEGAWYWSSTAPQNKDGSVYAVRFSDGHKRNIGAGYDASCRPVRFVEVTP
jgi:hypothetical protein